MKIQTLLNVIMAFVLIAYWGISARRIKKDRVRQTMPWSWLLVILVACLVLLADRLPFAQIRLVPPSPVVTFIGTLLEIGGVALAVWGRRQLGGNWSSAASVKEGHELVTYVCRSRASPHIVTLVALSGEEVIGGWVTLYSGDIADTFRYLGGYANALAGVSKQQAVLV